MAALELTGNGRVHDFECPLYSHIEGNLWLGGCPGAVAPEEAEVIISLYPWGRYSYNHRHQRWYTFTMHDSSTVPDTRLLEYVADLINESRRSAVTLVHCQKGINRSSLVTALALIRSGMEPGEAISLLRRRRSSWVLMNQAFELWLMCQEPGGNHG